MLERAADRLEVNRGRLLALFAKRGRQDVGTMRSPSCARRSITAAITPRRRGSRLRHKPMPGPTGESNELRYRGRGVFVCNQPVEFSRWRFSSAR